MKEYLLKNKETLTIERLMLADAPEILLFQNRIGGESDNMTFGKNEFRVNLDDEINLIKNMDNGGTVQIFIGKINGEIVSSISASFYTKRRLDHLSGCGVVVSRQKWNIGVGSAMMDYLIHYLKLRGDIRVVQLDVRSDNYGAKALYGKMGFEKVGVHRGYLHVGDEYFDVDIMEKYLF
ncbi:MAG: GNAT family N-acetyltransferase [Oscillospiraceae bacterium]